MKKYFLLFSILFQISLSYGQQLALYNSKTLFDGQENPSQRIFSPDTSRKYAFNFFIPGLNFGTDVHGSGQSTIKKLLYTGALNAQNLPLGEKQASNFKINSNTYIFAFRIFNSPYSSIEKGLSWQIRADIDGAVTNETLAILHDYKLFDTHEYTDAFNNDMDGISYHQFSFTYRENFTKRLGLGVKLSYLSGIAFNSLKMDRSAVTVNKSTNSYDVTLKGKYRSNFLYTEPDKNILIPGFKNPGMAIGLSANYKWKDWSAFANLKDLGIIFWKDEPYTYSFDQTLQVSGNPENGNTNLDEKLQLDLLTNPERSEFRTLINGKAEGVLSRDFGIYQPNFIISKNIFNNGGHVALVNTFRYHRLHFSLLNAYNLDKYMMTGGQLLIKSPNAEFYIGSDQILKTYYTTKGILLSDETVGKGSPAASIYLGFSMKFGKVQERWQNASYIPMDDDRPGFLKRIYRKVFKKKRFEGGRKTE